MSYGCSKYGVRERLGAVVEGQSPYKEERMRSLVSVLDLLSLKCLRVSSHENR